MLLFADIDYNYLWFLVPVLLVGIGLVHWGTIDFNKSQEPDKHINEHWK